MLDSLQIKNFRNLKELKIGHVDRINLITGKNNTGKSSILEAIAIYASRGDFSQIFQLLDYRGENFSQKNHSSTDSNESRDLIIKSLSAMFTGRAVNFYDEVTIFVGNINEGVHQSEKYITLRFVKYYDEILKNEQGESFRRKIANISKEEIYDDFKIGMEITSEKEGVILPLVGDVPYRHGFKGVNNRENFQFIRTANIDKETNGKLFDHITLTEKEKYVIEALRIIEPTTERIAFIGENPRERTAVIKLSNVSEVLPLRSMGDGINRILTIILALANSDNGFLLLDEFENGLHYTVQEKLWKIIFELSKVLNVQVFATTHSEDCISGFQRVLNNADNSQTGKLIRLDNSNGNIKSVEYSPRELQIACEQDIEAR